MKRLLPLKRQFVAQRSQAPRGRGVGAGRSGEGGIVARPCFAVCVEKERGKGAE